MQSAQCFNFNAAKLNKYFQIHSDYCVIATLLDPRLKLELYNDEDDPDQSAIDMEAARASLETAFKVYEEKWGSSAKSQERKDTYGPLGKRRKIAATINETKMFFDMLPLAHGDTNPLEWWKSNQTTFPILARMARDYLAIQSSSVASERAFSSAKQTCTDNRSRLSDQSMQATQCLKSWAKL
jgi:hypothetical protein